MTSLNHLEIEISNGKCILDTFIKFFSYIMHDIRCPYWEKSICTLDLWDETVQALEIQITWEKRSSNGKLKKRKQSNLRRNSENRQLKWYNKKSMQSILRLKCQQKKSVGISSQSCMESKILTIRALKEMQLIKNGRPATLQWRSRVLTLAKCLRIFGYQTGVSVQSF